MQLKNNYYVLTGGPGCGKTTVLDELHRRGYLCAEEVAREIIRQQMEAGGNALPWGNIPAYTAAMLEASVHIYREFEQENNLVFFDRGIPDTLAYARLTNQSEINYICQSVNRYRYNQTVFLFPAWEEIYHTDNERKQDFPEVVETCEIMKEMYLLSGYKVVEVPKITVKERADFILNSILK